MCLLTAFLCDRVAFGRRYDKNPLLKYFTAEDFGLEAEQISSGKFLNGFIYKNVKAAQNGKVIVFCHGMGPGQIAYTTEIAYFCNIGYTVVAFDVKGCNFSRGRNIKGMYEGVNTAVAAMDFARSRFPEWKIYLVGHSWGGYSALCASAERSVNAVVAISAPETPSKTTMYGAVNFGLPKPLAAVLRPFWWIINLFKYGAKGNANAAKRAVKSGVPTLLVHGGDDNVVNAKNAAYALADGENITKYYAHGKKHNPYNTVAAENKLAELQSGLMRVKKMTEQQKDEFFSKFDYSAATEEDGEVMNAIAEFLNKQ